MAYGGAVSGIQGTRSSEVAFQLSPPDGLKLWVDDERPAPDGWWWTQTSEQAILRLNDVGDAITEISLDHDLGGDDTTRRIVLWMCENDAWPATVRVHTANPVGREWLVGMAERYGPGVTR